MHRQNYWVGDSSLNPNPTLHRWANCCIEHTVMITSETRCFLHNSSKTSNLSFGRKYSCFLIQCACLVTKPKMHCHWSQTAHLYSNQLCALLIIWCSPLTAKCTATGLKRPISIPINCVHCWWFGVRHWLPNALPLVSNGPSLFQSIVCTVDDLVSATDCQMTVLTLPLSNTERYIRQGHCQCPSFTAIWVAGTSRLYIMYCYWLFCMVHNARHKNADISSMTKKKNKATLQWQYMSCTDNRGAIRR